MMIFFSLSNQALLIHNDNGGGDALGHWKDSPPWLHFIGISAKSICNLIGHICAIIVRLTLLHLDMKPGHEQGSK